MHFDALVRPVIFKVLREVLSYGCFATLLVQMGRFACATAKAQVYKYIESVYYIL